ncbi:hypothetical protein LPJ78_000862 [Coemansia sp. RSA 989]|nr:hypothetical protein LPJ68_000895 [Coemansia sp. RSA 1086]KAJ1753804.1 hypothetical protein LPJ79_000091 [Coemansia sp. RSA 1821]KAJ1867627.1 hypothetical protein LPJ78_000862 [Coemansia sp. RSA 989]KAJ1875890.1 hypothetical protein LPJ55_000304 [Coemansia sp. RSA 990]KAJ2632877.1 hypothetical protein H4R22_000922 [Coemansia sp. RSA 1290]KAJ2653771.1 hypothetical protein IWW40_000055 [Coemansia sp. RSA 1250]KAJ2676923.1 hypothetical protein IWW42_000261 [Coemansia sp. RSA 1085]
MGTVVVGFSHIVAMALYEAEVGAGDEDSSRGRGRGTSSRNEHQPGRSNSLPSNRLVPIKPTTPSPSSTMTWRVLYAIPPSSRPEIGPSGEKIPGPFSPPLRPATPDGPLTVLKSQDKLRKENEDFARKRRVQQLLQQAANSPSGGMGTYVGKLSKSNNPLIPVLPRPDTKQ